ncbi:hypothetical protein [Gimesia aquarii]|uniref:Uncharacterized protein n=1 Tax=Gimesia aquarii TaxID=2527964 RepID=A0A517VQF9_9PLAN|nr:hypothetical protein [Gimesia aquarii]QDT95255.1 hypothetical protein V144x_06970 [Gimesia aquarii]
MSDPREITRRLMTTAINSVEGSREYLESKHGEVWDTTSLQEEFTVLGFCSPFCIVQRKCDGVKGSVMLQHSPRYYFGFSPE